MSRRYFTYRHEALSHMKPGQKLRFTKGEGYWISGVPTQPPERFAMFDAINVANLPHGAPAYAGYVNGNWPTFEQIVKTFPKAMHLSIAVNSHADAECLDVEKGDATNETAVPWMKRQLAAYKHKPVVYTFLANAQALVDALAHAGIERHQYKLWIAHWTFHPHICTPACGLGLKGNADATQWTDKSGGKSLDESLCSPGFLTPQV